MVRPKHMGLKTRKEKLVKLIEDAEELGFSKKVIADYKRQLVGVEKQLQEQKEARVRFKEAEKEVEN